MIGTTLEIPDRMITIQIPDPFAIIVTITVEENLRERVKERESRTKARTGKSGVGQRRGPRRTGAKWRDCDGKQQPQWTSRAHGAMANGLKRETEEPGECLDDKSTTCGRKRAGSNKKAQGCMTTNTSGQ